MSSYLETNAYELQKANLSKNVENCFSSWECYLINYSIGSYYRFGSELNLIRNIGSDKIGIGVGLRFINSNLNSNFPNSYNLYLSSRELGPQISFRLKTPSFYGFHISCKIDYFYLLGAMVTDGSFISEKFPDGYNKFSNNVHSTYVGREIGISLSYKINDRVTISFGDQYLRAVVTPGNKNVRSRDPNFDLKETIKNKFLFGRTYGDEFESSYLQVTIKL